MVICGYAARISPTIFSTLIRDLHKTIISPDSVALLQLFRLSLCAWRRIAWMRVLCRPSGPQPRSIRLLPDSPLPSGLQAGPWIDPLSTSQAGLCPANVSSFRPCTHDDTLARHFTNGSLVRNFKLTTGFQTASLPRLRRRRALSQSCKIIVASTTHGFLIPPARPA